jgi:hypothetical protein
VTDCDQKLALFVSDSRHATRDGLQHIEVLPPASFRWVVIELGGLADRGLDPKDIHVMHFFTERPPCDMEVILDHLVLLEPDEPLPTASSGYVAQLAPLLTRQVTAMRDALATSRAALEPTARTSPEIEAWAEARLQDLQAQVDAFARQVAAADPALAGDRLTPGRLETELNALSSAIRFRADFARLRPKVQVGRPRTDLSVGFATSMEKILPRAGQPSLTVTDRLAVSLARNEAESLQVLVLPWESDLRQVQVRVTDLRGSGRARFAAANTDAAPVGYVETKSVPPYGSSHVGWWPDPILGFMDAADIAEGDLQAFWVRLRAPKDQPPGLYRGRLEVLVEGKPAFAFPLQVRVHPFALPDASPLPLAITFGPEHNVIPATKDAQEAWRQSADYPINAWKRHRLEWGDFLADYYITYDSLYAYGPQQRTIPDFEVLQRLHDQGRLGWFNLGYYGILGESPEDAEAWDKANLGRILPAYERAKELGLLDHAYIYGCDEHPPEMFAGVERAAARLKEKCPGVPVMTTTYDHSFGLGSVIKSMEAFCPLTPSFNPDLAAESRTAGHQVWWYICCGPHHPYPNMFVEYPAIEGRLLMGALTAKYRPDGFLYYQISIWNSQKPITSGPFTDWDPRSWTTYHGDGSWTCVGPDGTPLPTIRLENFRDGLEDYAYHRLLEATIAKVEAGDREPGAGTAERTAWLAGAKALLEVPPAVAKSLTEYTSDPAAVYAWRERLAEAIATAGDRGP